MDLKEFLERKTNTRHPWELSRFQFFNLLLKKHLKPGQSVRVLDVGSGDTWLARQIYKTLPEGSSMTCVDENYTDAIITKMSSKVPVELTSTLPADKTFDVILMLDVLEHVYNDHDFMDQILKHATDETLILISVPAFPSLFGAHDRWLGHLRRYSRSSLSKLLNERGLKTNRIGGLFHSLIYVRTIQVLMEKLFGARKEPKGVKDWEHNWPVTMIVLATLNFDWKLAMVLGQLGIPIPGLSWWCVCQKRS